MWFLTTDQVERFFLSIFISVDYFVSVFGSESV